MDSCSQLGINISPEHIIKGPSTIEGGANAAKEYCKLSNAPRALFFESDSMAIGALHTFHKLNIRIPEDIEILAVGMLDYESTSLCIPSLSVIGMQNPKISSLIIEILKEKLANNDLSPVDRIVNAEIILRESFT